VADPSSPSAALFRYLGVKGYPILEQSGHFMAGHGRLSRCAYYSANKEFLRKQTWTGAQVISTEYSSVLIQKNLNFQKLLNDI
jgi:hypothetical protein